jgi:hypothetical protein
MTDQIRDVPKEFLIRRRTWKLSRIAQQTIWILFTIAGILAGLAVTSFAPELQEKGMIRYLGFVSAVSTAILSLFKPIQLADKFLDAWRILDHACLRYKYDPTATIDTLFEAMNRGEKVIGKSSNGQPISPSPAPRPDRINGSTREPEAKETVKEL